MLNNINIENKLYFYLNLYYFYMEILLKTSLEI